MRSDHHQPLFHHLSRPERKHLEATLRGIRERISSRDTAQLLRLVVGQLVHGAQAEVEATGSSIDRSDVDSLVDLAGLVVDAVAVAAVRAVPAGDGRGAADEGEFGQRAEGRVALGDEAVGTVGAGDGGQGGAGVVVGRVVGDRHGGGAGLEGGGGGQGRGETEGEDSEGGGEELHFESSVD